MLIDTPKQINNNRKHEDNKMKKAAIYMRVSTARQEEEQTIENQKMELVNRIKEDSNLLLPECIYKDEGWSGAIIQRPDLDRMRADARENKFDVLYFYDRGRISRIYVHQEIILEELRELGIEIISLHDINGETEEAKLMGGFMGLFAQYERVKITERMRIGKIRKVKESGKLLGYQPKYGYNYVSRIKSGPNARECSFTINNEQAAIVRQVFEWIADGISKHEVRRRLFKMGVPPPKGKRDQWSGGTLDRMVRDTTYIGDHYYNKSESVPTKNPQNPELKYRKTIKGSRIRRPKEEWYKVKVPALVSREIFDKVQVRLEKNKRSNKRNNSKNEYLVNSLIECVCGQARTGDPGAKGSRYYRCNDRLSKYPLPRTCRENGINVAVLDALVWNNIEELLTHPELVVEQAKRWQKEASPIEAQIEILKHRQAKLDDEERRYVKAYGQAVMPEQLYKDNMYEIREKRMQIASEMSALEDELINKPAIPLENLVDGVIELVRNLDFSDKKQIIRKLVTKIVATKKEVTIWGHIPILATQQVGLDVKHRHCRPPQRRQINTFQCAHRQQYSGCELSVCDNRAEYGNCACSGRTARQACRTIQNR